MQNKGGREDKQRVVWMTRWGVLGAVLVMIAALYSTFNQVEPEIMLAAPTTLTFSGEDLQREPLDAIVVRLHNFIVRCSEADLLAANAYIDPQSELAGHPEAACGVVAGMLHNALQTNYRFERFAVVDDEASVYIAIQEQQSVSQRYIFDMRRVKGKWYFTVP